MNVRVYRCDQCDVPMYLADVRKCPFCPGTFQPTARPLLTIVKAG